MLNIIMCIQLFILSPTAKTQFYHPLKTPYNKERAGEG